MFRIKITYPINEEPENLINVLNNNYRVIKVSKEYYSKGKEPHKRIHVDLIQK